MTTTAASACASTGRFDVPLRAAVEVFLGSPAEVSVRRRRSEVNLGRTVVRSTGLNKDRRDRRYAVLPSNGRARWIIPVGSTPIAVGGFQLYTPYALRGRILKFAMEGLARTGCLNVFSSQLSISSPDLLPLEKMLSEVTGEADPVCAMSVGVKGSCCKLTVQAMRSDGTVLGYVKLPLVLGAIARLRNEAATLKALYENEAIRPHIPRVLFDGSCGTSSYVLFTSAGPAAPGPMLYGRMHEELLTKIWSIQPREKSGKTLVQDIAALWKQAQLTLGPTLHAIGERALDWSAQRLEDSIVRCGLMHGDFAPWNMRVRSRHLFLFDWESSEWEAPNLWDIFHFYTQTRTLLNGGRRSPLPIEETGPTQASYLLYLLYSLHNALTETGNNSAQVCARQKVLSQELVRVAGHNT